jgi:orotate phosphoribosyltransferase
MNDIEGQALLQASGALLEGHFLLSSGRHSALYIEKFRILEQPWLSERFAREIAGKFHDAGINLVAGLLTGGILVAHEVAKLLQCRVVFPERISGTLEFRRGFHVNSNAKVLVVEDVLTTGGSVAELITLLQGLGAQISGVACLVQRGEPDLDSPLFSVVKLPLKTYSASNCPLCASGIELEKRGSS